LSTVHRLLALALLAALGGCGGQSGPVTSATPTTEVTRTVEQDGRFVALIGPRRQHAEPFLGVPSTNFYALRSWVDTRTGETVHQLYVVDSYAGAERKWNAARDGQGQELRFVEISRNEITCERACSYAEEFAATLPEALLQASAGGLTVTFFASTGVQKTIAVAGELVQKQLAAVAAARPGRPAAVLGRERRS
jgi:predicted small lipoprotein YifL